MQENKNKKEMRSALEIPLDGCIIRVPNLKSGALQTPCLAWEMDCSVRPRRPDLNHVAETEISQRVIRGILHSIMRNKIVI
jgi:hypothetical protein